MGIVIKGCELNFLVFFRIHCDIPLIYFCAQPDCVRPYPYWTIFSSPFFYFTYLSIYFTYIVYIHIFMFLHTLFLRSWTRNSDCEKKMEQNYLDGSAFATVFYGPMQPCLTWFFEHLISLIVLVLNLWHSEQDFFSFCRELIFELERLG